MAWTSDLNRRVRTAERAHGGLCRARLGRLEQPRPGLSLLLQPCARSRDFAAGRDPDGAPLYGGSPAERCFAGEPRRPPCPRRREGGLAARHAGAALRRRPGADPVDGIRRGRPAGGTSGGAGPLWGDVVLSGRDLAASYHLAVTVDDALQGVSDVVRGRDLLAATSVHRLLQDAARPCRRRAIVTIGWFSTRAATKMSKSRALALACAICAPRAPPPRIFARRSALRRAGVALGRRDQLTLAVDRELAFRQRCAATAGACAIN